MIFFKNWTKTSLRISLCDNCTMIQTSETSAALTLKNVFSIANRRLIRIKTVPIDSDGICLLRDFKNIFHRPTIGFNNEQLHRNRRMLIGNRVTLNIDSRKSTVFQSAGLRKSILRADASVAFPFKHLARFASVYCHIGIFVHDVFLWITWVELSRSTRLFRARW